MLKGFLVVKGNFTQRQFDMMGRIWDKVQRTCNADEESFPLIQLAGNEGNLGYVLIDTNTGEIEMEALFKE